MIKVRSDKHMREFSALADGVFCLLGLSGEGYVEAVFVTAAEMRTLNARTRGMDAATDVLSFPAVDKVLPLTRQNYPVDFDEGVGAVFLGSVVLSGAAIRRQAAAYGHSLKRERAYLFVHGMLHLLGYDHETDGQRVVMREAEERVLTAAGIR